MKKSISLVVAFIFAFVCFSTNVNAKVIYNSKEYTEYDFDFISYASSLFTDEQLIYLNDYFDNYTDYNITYCSVKPYYHSSRVYFYCYEELVFTKSYVNSSWFTFGYSINQYVFYYNIDNPFNIVFSVFNGNQYARFLYGVSDSGNEIPFWFKNDLVISDNVPVSYYIEDNIYEVIDNSLKQQYNFQNYIVPGFPLYSLINLRLGDYVGVPIDADYTINYYYDNVLQSDLSITNKAYVDSVITLDNLDKVKDDIYFLDESRDYSIIIDAYAENIINVYYKSYDMNYNVNVYLDDIYYQSHSYVGTAKLGSEVVLENLLETINVYTLDNREYKLSVSENSQLNYINVYYYSENYDTKYQDIDTTGKFYISFDWVYIKELFSLNGNYTQTEQFIIVYVVNFLFYAIVVVVGYFGLKLLNKLLSILKMF